MSSPEETTPALPVPIADARAMLRMGGGTDDAVVAALIRAATALCEQFTGRALMERERRETIAATGAWQRLGATPVRSIVTVEGQAADGTLFPLPVDAYAIDIDSSGDGWVRVMAPQASAARVTARIGMATSTAALPDGLRHGIIQLAQHLHRTRDGEAPQDPPAVIAALWRPWRRMRLMGATDPAGAARPLGARA